MNRNTAENKCRPFQWRYLFICLFTFDYKALFVWVKDRTCIKIAISAFAASTFLNQFLVLFCYVYLLKSLLGNKTICQSMRKLPCAV